MAVASYRVTRNGTLVASPGGGSTAWTDPNVALGATYTYALAAVDTSGNTGPAASVTVTMPAAPGPTPAPTADPSASPEPSTTPGPPGPTPAPSPTATPAPTATPSPTATPTPTATPDAPPRHPRPRLRPARTWGPPRFPTRSRPLPQRPASASAWGAAVDDVGVAGYRITRNGTAVVTANGTTWTDTGRKPLTTYTYTVEAVDSAGHVSDPAVVAATTRADTVRPSSPRSFHRVSRSGHYATFAWRAATDNVKVVRYYVYRVGRSAPVARDDTTRIRIPTVYGAYYYVRAIDAAHNRSLASARARGR